METSLAQLQISQETLQRLTHFQIASLGRILEHPPHALVKVVRLMSSENLKMELFRLNVPIHAIEYPYNLLESYMKDIFSDWEFDERDRNQLLTALARSCIIYLFQ